jgi:alpha-1,2-mannosyltransferase
VVSEGAPVIREIELALVDSRSMPPSRLAPEHALGLAVVALALTVNAATLFFINGKDVDFVVFYQEGRALLGHQPLYADRSNMNSPALTALIFAPLALLPYRTAQSVWLVLSVIAVVLGGRLIVRELRLSRTQVLCAIAGLGMMHGSFQAWAIGQLTWPVLFYPITKAWLAYRHGTLDRAGAWLGIAVAAKPPLAFVAVLLPWPVWGVAGVISAAISMLTLPVTGWSAWLRWLETVRQVDWLARPFNASVWAAAARLQVGRDTGRSIAVEDLPIVVIVLVITALVGLSLQTLRAEGDRRFFLAGLFSTLASPLGWGYYLPLLAGPAIAAWPGHVGTLVLAGMLVRFGTSSDAHLVEDWLLFGSVLLAWWAWTHQSITAGAPATELNTR